MPFQRIPSMPCGTIRTSEAEVQAVYGNSAWLRRFHRSHEYEPSDSEVETDTEADSEIQSVHSNDSRPLEDLDPDYLTMSYGYTSDHSNSAGEQSDSD